MFQGLNAILYYDNKDTRSYVSLIPTSAHSGDGMGDLISQVVELTQTRLPEKLSFSEYLDGIVLEVGSLSVIYSFVIFMSSWVCCLMVNKVSPS